MSLGNIEEFSWYPHVHVLWQENVWDDTTWFVEWVNKTGKPATKNNDQFVVSFTAQQTKEFREAVARQSRIVWYCLTLFRMGFFGTAHGCGGGKKVPLFLKHIARILHWWNWTQLYLT